MTSRREYCPIACAVGVLGDRWTPLIIRELMVGASGFNEIHRGIPRASRSLLAQRLRELERRGLVDHTANGPGLSGSYELTPAGQALTDIVWAMGHWAAEWVFGDPTDDDCDGLSLIWRTQQFAIPAKLPKDRTVVHLVLTGAGGAQGWLDIQGPASPSARTTKASLSISPSRPTPPRCSAGSSASYLSATSSPTATPASSDRAAWPRPSPPGSTPRCTPRPCAEASNAGSGTPSRPEVELGICGRGSACTPVVLHSPYRMLAGERPTLW